jgi:phosphohistidine phosphatase SixA
MSGITVFTTRRRLSCRAVRLYLVRHAEAAPGDPDELRPLTAHGRDQARALGRRLHAENARPETVLTSPLLRARETGDELARALGARSEPDDRLAPGASLDDLRAAIAGRGEQVVVVGHQPDCGQIAAALTGREPAFPTAGLAVLELD